MPTIKIGDKDCSFEGKKTILEVALDHNIDIPHYCYHPGLSIVASCRICLAEVAQPNPRNDNKLELIPKLVPTCQHLAVDGAEVLTESEKSLANRKAVMEYLLINHPLDCPVCDQAGECFLQDYSYKHGRGYSRFDENKVKNPKKDIGDHVLLYSDRCIMCTRCVRFTREVSGDGELGVNMRGNQAEIDVFPGRPLNNELSGNVVDICPVGALLDKDFLFEQRVWYLNSTPGIDGITASGDNIWVEHNEGRVYRIKPRENADVNQWWISDEIRYGWNFVHDPQRLDTPLWLEGHDQVECDWNHAYREVIDGIRSVTSAGKRLTAIISPMISCEDAYLMAKFARAIDPDALIVTGPTPIDGEDKEFAGGYKIYAEKAPNARGIRRVLEQLVGADQILDHTQLTALLNDRESGSEVGAVLITGNYPSPWITAALGEGVADRFVALIDTLPNRLTGKADVVLPAATWVEKAGTFENANGRLQAFEQAIQPIEFVRSEGQIALDLMAAAQIADPSRFDVNTVRDELGGVFTDNLHRATSEDVRVPDVQYVEI